MPKRKEQAQATKSPTASRGRPTAYTPSIASEICAQLAAGNSLRSICRDERFPPASTVRGWVIDDREGFSAQYMRATQIRALEWGEELTEISDDNSLDITEDDEGNERVNHDHIQRAKLRVDTRKWLMSKVLPKIYGDTLKLQGDPTAPVRFIIDGLEAKK